jgi:hypothetical protein
MARINNIVQWKTWYPGFDTLQLLVLEQKNERVIAAKAPGDITIVLTAIQEDQVVAEFRSSRKNPLVNGWKIITYSNSDSVTLQWWMDFRLRWYPWEKFASLLLEKNYGARMEQGLTRLKTEVEK